jgi:SAM-dependent methyltransferase
MWDERYTEPGWAYGTEPNEFLAAHADALPAGGRVVVLFAGQGRNAVFLATRGHPVVAVDSSAAGLERARALAAERGVDVETVHADVTSWDPGPDSFDGVVSIWSPLTGVERAASYARMVRALRPGGVFLMEAYRPEQLGFGTGGPRTVDRLVDPAAVPGELDGLVIERMQVLERDVREGKYHSGRSAVVQVVARRPA